MLSYIMRMEAQHEQDKSDTDFRSLVFANDPSMYFKLFDKDEEQREIEDGIEWMTPDSADEIERILRELDAKEKEQGEQADAHSTPAEGPETS